LYFYNINTLAVLSWIRKKNVLVVLKIETVLLNIVKTNNATLKLKLNLVHVLSYRQAHLYL